LGAKSKLLYSETVRNRTHVYKQFLLRIIDIMTSQDIDPSSWDTLDILVIKQICVVGQGSSDRARSTIRRNISPPSSQSKSKTSKKPAEAGA
jgi:hypothetical protein